MKKTTRRSKLSQTKFEDVVRFKPWDQVYVAWNWVYWFVLPIKLTVHSVEQMKDGQVILTVGPRGDPIGGGGSHFILPVRNAFKTLAEAVEATRKWNRAVVDNLLRGVPAEQQEDMPMK